MDQTSLKNAAFIVAVLILSAVCSIGLVMLLGQNILSPVAMALQAVG